ncbi:C-Myc-binding protein homolog isoform X1 [Sorghum bicolor]|uniref:C-Myc-binding protein homolog isoform X1 n=1 Tax=Sorghum bicolor TaxID=4558 RepID=UPI000B425D9A|nr:C-Myc-binding protein homolog isoform X1 [Sorghum bicolor]|eukprot:XP_021308411.1 C-Myc-binding protein homolog isoform X1 [Sorghum bicolor]
MDREAKKEAFRKYLESSGVLDTLTKVLVALYEENDKPSSAVEFVQQKLGGPSISDYEKLKAEKLDLQLKYDKLLETHKETCRQVCNVTVLAVYTTVCLDYLQQSSPKIQDLFILWVALQVKGSIPIFSLLQQQDLKDNTLCKWVSRKEDT